MMKKQSQNGKEMILDGGMNILTDLIQKRNLKKSMEPGIILTALATCLKASGKSIQMANGTI